MTAAHTAVAEPAPTAAPAVAWSQRIRRVGGRIQLAFAAFWLVRGAGSVGGAAGRVLLGSGIVLAAAALVYSLSATAGTGRRPTGPGAKRIERSVTIATVVELAASVVAPAVVTTVGHRDWVLPSIAITIGPLLLWLDHLVDIPRYRPVGWSLTLGPVVLVALLSGSALAAVTGLGAGMVLLVTATAGFHDLAGLRSSRPAGAARPAPRTPSPSPGSALDRRFRSLFNPATGEHIEFTAVAEDNDSEIIRFNWTSVPGGIITEHVHPHQEERFTITSGEATFTVHGLEHLAGAGETVVIPAGTPHSAGNTGPVAVEGIVELRPALHSRQWHEALAGLAAAGRTSSRGAPRNPLQLGATMWSFRHESRATSPPIWVQNLLLAPLWALARVCGVRPYRDDWDSRI